MSQEHLSDAAATPGRTWRLLVLWILASVPSMGLAGALGGGIGEALSGEDSFGFRLGFSGAALLSAGYGMAWAAALALPHLVTLRAWIGASRLFGDTDETRLRILFGMALWSLPQAVIVAAAGEPVLFLLAWPIVTTGLWLPRVWVPALRPGAFTGSRET